MFKVKFLLLLLISCGYVYSKTIYPPFLPESDYLIYEDTLIRKGKVKRGQGLFQAVRSVGIEDNGLALELIEKLRDEVEFSKIQVGDPMEARYREGKLIYFSYSQIPSDVHILEYNVELGDYEYRFQENKTVWKYNLITGDLRESSTLLENLLAQGLSRSVTQEIINVLLCKINFRMHARKEDEYKILLKERIYQDKVIETKILYTSYNGVNTGLEEAFFYEDEEPKSSFTAHYTEDGEPLILSLLRYPLTRMHVRSSFGMRLHPVTRRRTLHAGVDLRGRVGTPVHSVASGVVVESNYNDFGGNRIAIRHNDKSTSYYMHLHKRFVKKGQRVKSYQVIGQVGQTGRVTGPHLHFGFKNEKGRWINPLSKRMIATAKLSGDRFDRLKDKIRETRDFLFELSFYSKGAISLAPNIQDPEDFTQLISEMK